MKQNESYIYDSGNSKTSDLRRLLLNLSEKNEAMNMLLHQILLFTIHG